MKKSTFLKSLSSLTLSACLLFAVSCADPQEEMIEPSNATSKANKGNDDMMSEIAKVYVADLMPLNSSGVMGTATFKINEGNKFHATVHAKGLAPNVPHPQHIHGFVVSGAEATCPPASAAGEDGSLSIADGAPFYGPVIVPLDDMLVPLTSDDFPMANPAGNLNYNEMVGLYDLVTAIDAKYDGMQDMSDLALSKRVVVIHGAFTIVVDGMEMVVSADTEGATYNPFLPVACGMIMERK